MSDAITRLKAKALLGAALPSLTSARTLFSSVPAGAGVARVTVRTAGITVTTDGATPTAGGVGIDLPVGTHEFVGPRDDLVAMKAIQNGGTATGYVEFFELQRSVA